mgnify:FL=1
MLELLVFVAGSYVIIQYMYPRKKYTNKSSQTEMIKINKTTQTDDSDDSMSIDLSDMEIDEHFFHIKSV